MVLSKSFTRRVWMVAACAIGGCVLAMTARAQTTTGGSTFGTSGLGTTGTQGTTGSRFGTTGAQGTTTGTQNTGTTSTGGLNFQQLLSQAGLGGTSTGSSGLGSSSTGSLGTTGGRTGAGTTGTSGLAGLGGLGGGTSGRSGQGRSPMTNSPYASRAAAIAARRPGLQVQQAVAVEQGNSQLITNATPIQDKSFFRLAFEQIVRTILDSINQGFSSGLGNLGTGGLGSLGGLSSLGSLFQNPSQTPNQQNQITPIQNAITSGQGTSAAVP